jgi:Cu2+-exporting ATPase
LVILTVGSGVITFLGRYFLGNVAAITALTFAISAIVIACPDTLELAWRLGGRASVASAERI